MVKELRGRENRRLFVLASDELSSLITSLSTTAMEALRMPNAKFLNPLLVFRNSPFSDFDVVEGAVPCPGDTDLMELGLIDDGALKCLCFRSSPVPVPGSTPPLASGAVNISAPSEGSDRASRSSWRFSSVC